MSDWTRARARLAVQTRHGADEQTLAELRRDVRAARLAEQIERTVAALPPLTDEQRAKLTALLNA